MKHTYKHRWGLVLLIGILILAVGCQSQAPPTDAPAPTSSVLVPAKQTDQHSENATPEPSPVPLVVTQQSVVSSEPTDDEDYAEFFSMAKAAILTPGLKEDLVPQGLCAIPQSDRIVVSFYSDYTPTSILAVIDTQTGQLSHWVGLQNVDGTPYTGHAGGIASDGKNIWVCSDGSARRMLVEDLLAAKPGEELRFIDSFPTGTRASSANYSHGILWIGDFFTSGGNYNTDKSHHMKTPDGSKHYAWAVGFVGDPDSESGLKADTQNSITVVPDYVLSLPARIQGFTRTDTGQFVLSESYGRKNDSHLMVFEDVLQLEPDTTVQIGSNDVPLWFLDSRMLVKTIVTPPMSEGIDWMNGAVYQLYESGATKYLDTAVNPVDYIYRVELP